MAERNDQQLESPQAKTDLSSGFRPLSSVLRPLSSVFTNVPAGRHSNKEFPGRGFARTANTCSW